MMRLRLIGGDDGIDKIMIDDVDITQSVAAIDIKIASTAEVKLTLLASVDVDVQNDLLKLEKEQHVKINTLDNPVGRFVRVR